MVKIQLEQIKKTRCHCGYEFGVIQFNGYGQKSVIPSFCPDCGMFIVKEKLGYNEGKLTKSILQSVRG